jgi:hypothetical protein
MSCLDRYDIKVGYILEKKLYLQYNYNTVSSGHITNSLFGSFDVTNATDRVGFIVKYT